MSEIDNKISFLSDSVSLTFENIKFADQKASIILALNSSIAGAAYAIGVFKGSPIEWHMISITGFLCLALAILSCVWVIFPRPRAHKLGKGLCHPQRVMLHNGKDEFHNHLVNASEEELLRSITDLVYEASRINNAKYRALISSITISATSWVFLALSAVISLESS